MRAGALPLDLQASVCSPTFARPFPTLFNAHMYTHAHSEHGIAESNEEIGPCDGAMPAVPETGGAGGGAAGGSAAGGSAATTPRTLADIVHPQKWNTEQVVAWVRRANRGAFGRYADSFKGVDGKTMCKFGSKVSACRLAPPPRRCSHPNYLAS